MIIHVPWQCQLTSVCSVTVIRSKSYWKNRCGIKWKSQSKFNVHKILSLWFFFWYRKRGFSGESIYRKRNSFPLPTIDLINPDTISRIRGLCSKLFSYFMSSIKNTRIWCLTISIKIKTYESLKIEQEKNMNLYPENDFQEFFSGLSTTKSTHRKLTK